MCQHVTGKAKKRPGLSKVLVSALGQNRQRNAKDHQEPATNQAHKLKPQYANLENYEDLPSFIEICEHLLKSPRIFMHIPPEAKLQTNSRIAGPRWEGRRCHASGVLH